MPHDLTNDELRSMCERAIQHGIGGELRWIVMELLARLDAEAAMEKHEMWIYRVVGITDPDKRWRASCWVTKHQCGCEGVGATMELAVAACVAKIKTLTPKEQP